MTSYGQKLDDLVLTMKRAAEAALPMAKLVLLKAVKSMSVSDEKNSDRPRWLSATTDRDRSAFRPV